MDSLEYLIPPVKKTHGILGRDLLFNPGFQRQTDFKLIKKIRKKSTRQIRVPILHESELQTSTSVILQKTTETLFHRHSFLNSTGKKDCVTVDKPTIKVTIIPKVAETQTSKIFNKRCDRAKKLQSTVSNQENSIKDKNIYLMVRGQRREKVYELKGTESTSLRNKTFNTSKYEDISIHQISNSKRLINSLNMEKRKRNKKSEPNNNNNNNKHCACPNIKSNEKFKDLNAHKSRVTIVGQLGLTRDDQYVLNCAATVNDKPIATNFVQKNYNKTWNSKGIDNNAESFTPKFNTTGFSNDRNDFRRFRQQDSNVQTDVCWANKCMVMNLESNSKQYRMTSQATQANLNHPNYKPSKDLKNKDIQCNFDILTAKNNVYNIEGDDNVLKDCKSPLVIISVYPNKEDHMNFPVKIIQHKNSNQNKIISNKDRNLSKVKATNDQKFTFNKSEQKSFRSRSPSPATKAAPYKNVDMVLRKNTPINKINPQHPKNVSKSTHKLNYPKKDVNCYCPNTKCLKNQEMLKQVTNPVRNTQEADKTKVKRALVNNFLKSIDRIDQIQTKTKFLGPKNNTSRVAININGERERYDVLFEQGNSDTGLTVRKTLKRTQTHNTNNEVDNNSLENFLMLSDEVKDTSDIEMYSRETRDISKVVPPIAPSIKLAPRLNIRDSLEIFHSREDQSDTRLNTAEVKNKYLVTDSFYNFDFSAPIKHYRGDNCAIPDPNERDKEIRELLGIVRQQRNPSKNEVSIESEDILTEKKKEDDCCCKCSKGLMTELRLSKFFTSKCLKKLRLKHQTKAINASTQSNVKRTSNNACACPMKVPEPIATGDQSSDDTSEHSVTPLEEDSPDSEVLLKQKKEISPDYKTVSQKDNISERNTKTSALSTQDKITLTKKSMSRSKEEKNASDKLYQKSIMPTDIPQEEQFVTNKEPVIEQSLILNRNIQIFLQVEQFTKQKPIILTRKQYDKVKKTIQCTISKNFSMERKRCNLKKCNVVSIGEIKVKPKFQQQIRYDREVQTERSEIQQNVRRHIHTQHNYNNKRTKSRNPEENGCSEKKINKIYIADVANDANYNKDFMEKHIKVDELSPRQTVSTMEIRYANISYLNHITISSTHFGDGLHNNGNDFPKPSTSIHTIFKGHRKSATPNLGTSEFSLCSAITDANESVKSVRTPYVGDAKPKKPFLQRLISCLVMRSAETSVLKEVAPARKVPTANSSVDSYHISTSLGALEMNSSLYDTSASFYSNHTTIPLNKMKRGFFSSVRGFLSTRRS